MSGTGEVIDTDVHCTPASMDALIPYLDDYWRDYIAGAELRLSPTLAGAYPPGAPTSATPQARASGSFPPHTVGELAAQLLDDDGAGAPHGHGGPHRAILNCLSSFDVSRNAYFEAALTRAVNEWLRAEWLDRDERLRASMVVSTLDPEAAVAEIERLGADDRFVQVLLPVRTGVSYGNKFYHPVYAAAADHGLVIGLHAWGRLAHAASPTGMTHSYLEDYLGNSQFAVQAQVISLVTEGVFEQFPSLRVSLSECGFSWLPPLLWRFDKDWKAVWREVPWLKDKPSEYVYRHFRATTAPAQLPAADGQLAELMDMLRPGEFLMFASDYPHDHGTGGQRLLDALDDDTRRAVLCGNAAQFYSL
jgi:predicted TIM-barrel fold metal-dependent hydrolase